MTTYRIAESADILGVSDDTVRRWIDNGRLPASEAGPGGRTTISGADLATLASELADHPERDDRRSVSVSARNRLDGIITKVTKDTVMAQVEMICGPYRMVSLMSSEAATDLGLETGVRAIASVKSTNVVIERA
ncbi:helix-turn-helix domain-containing protein [Nocardioides sp. JQ2195]|uniref:TOBE domain-containing protein n=1 Tax=Nocardioides sp. JQ2195 TaxID=2592334 RepID=UPI00197D2E9F|nr:helix-turn-helix domain-containing protein [Nocardioides sp. JQ2195]